MIPSPYNFVPVSPYVFLPDWWRQVSQDVPFSDGLCGWLELGLVAETPLLVGGETDRSGNGPARKQFVMLGDKPAIPGSSLKGMLRAVVEIAAYGKLRPINTHRYSIRDLYDEANYRRYLTRTVGAGTYETLVQAGWLSRTWEGDREVWKLTPCRFARVDFSELASFAGREKRSLTKSDLQMRQSARRKHELWAKAGLPLPVSAKLAPVEDHRHSCGRLRYAKATDLARTAAPGLTEGRLVFTGQPGNKKHMDFFFYDEPGAGQPEVFNTQLGSALIDDFRFIHREGQERHQADYRGNDEYRLMEQALEREHRAPVFYLPGPGGTPRALGLAMMFKLACEYSVGELRARHLPLHEQTLRPDLAELLFGRVADDDSLRGRVTLEPAVLEGEPRMAAEVTTVMGAPKASFVPSYLVQMSSSERRGGYTTYMQASARLRGWKRYPVRGQTQQPFIPDKLKDTVKSRLCPLAAGSKFKTRLHFHNLRPCELGAILWALSFGGNTECRHSLGSGRPYGYGQVRLEAGALQVERVTGALDERTASDLVKSFVDLMERDQPGWSTGESVTQLRAMADPRQGKARLQELVYPRLEGAGKNEFVDAKKRGDYLEPYATHGGVSDARRLQARYEERLRELGLEREKPDESARPVALPVQPRPAIAPVATRPPEPAESAETWAEATLSYDASGGGKLIVARKSGDGKITCPVAQAQPWFGALGEQAMAKLKKGKALPGQAFVTRTGQAPWRLREFRPTA